MKMSSWLVLALSLGLSVSALAAEPKIDTEEQKTIYAIGLALAQSLQPYNLTPAEIDLVKAGLTDGLTPNAKPKVDLKEYRAKLQQLGTDRAKQAAEQEKKDAQGFLDKMAKEKGATKTESGLILIPVKEGTGPSPQPTDTVKVHYHGTLRDGTVFDSSVERGTPATFPLNRVIPCWTEGMQKLKVGGKAKLVCPSAIAYGDRGAPPKIKPGAPLVFEVELISIEPKAEKPAENPAEKPAGHP
jgi:FKBP-type peptidyl-prolyl cis-trans isomerase FkpA/FKBP-type peptidyl-prolyl cis-trans isomerase FklB